MSFRFKVLCDKNLVDQSFSFDDSQEFFKYCAENFSDETEVHDFAQTLKNKFSDLKIIVLDTRTKMFSEVFKVED